MDNKKITYVSSAGIHFNERETPKSDRGALVSGVIA